MCCFTFPRNHEKIVFQRNTLEKKQNRQTENTDFWHFWKQGLRETFCCNPQLGQFFKTTKTRNKDKITTKQPKIESKMSFRKRVFQEDIWKKIIKITRNKKQWKKYILRKRRGRQRNDNAKREKTKYWKRRKTGRQIRRQRRQRRGEDNEEEEEEEKTRKTTRRRRRRRRRRRSRTIPNNIWTKGFGRPKHQNSVKLQEMVLSCLLTTKQKTMTKRKKEGLGEVRPFRPLNLPKHTQNPNPPPQRNNPPNKKRKCVLSKNAFLALVKNSLKPNQLEKKM